MATVREGLFDELLRTEPIFRNRDVLRHDTYTPQRLPHRDEELSRLAGILVAALRGDTPSNVFIYGKTGTGKTAVARYVNEELTRVGREQGRAVDYVYVNCSNVDTEYRVLTKIINESVRSGVDGRVPFTGWPTDEVYSKLLRVMDTRDGATIVILDEIDKLVFNSGDRLLYKLSEINRELKHARVSLIGISNDLRFTEALDPRVKSRLGEEEIVFRPYNAEQLQDILRQRAEIAFGRGVLSEGVIPLCAALAAQEHGDARRALDLLRASAEMAERANSRFVTERHVRAAQQKLELDRVTEVVRTLPTQSKLVLLSAIVGEENGIATSETGLTTGEVYAIYGELSALGGLDRLTQRRVTDLISELDMMGILGARVISKGRYGRTKAIRLSVSRADTRKVLMEDEAVQRVAGYRPVRQARLL